MNGIELLKQKLPYDTDYEYGWQHQTGIDNVYLLNGKIHQTRTKDGKCRVISFPVSKNKLVGIPSNIRINEN